MDTQQLTAPQAAALEWIIVEALEIGWQRDLMPKDALAEASDLLLIAQLSGHEPSIASATELVAAAQKRVADLPRKPGALLPTFEAAMRLYDDTYSDRDPQLHAARRAGFATMWFIENVGEDTPDRTDVFFAVRSIARAGQ